MGERAEESSSSTDGEGDGAEGGGESEEEESEGKKAEEKRDRFVAQLYKYQEERGTNRQHQDYFAPPGKKILNSILKYLVLQQTTICLRQMCF